MVKPSAKTNDGRCKMATLTVPVRRVRRVAGGYVVQELTALGRWKKVSAYYQHSTSAFAALGRMTAHAAA